MNRFALQALAVGAMAASALLLLTRSVHHPEPERATLEALVGLPLSAPSYNPAMTPLQRATGTARFLDGPHDAYP